MNLENGVIEVKMLSWIQKPSAFEFAQGFIGLSFRVNENNTAFESIYLRPNVGRSESQFVLLKFEARATYPYHNHPAGEEIYVLSGEAILGNVTLKTGDYLYTPPNFTHSVTTNTGCTMLFVVPEEVEIINQAN